MQAPEEIAGTASEEPAAVAPKLLADDLIREAESPASELAEQFQLSHRPSVLLPRSPPDLLPPLFL